MTPQAATARVMKTPHRWKGKRSLDVRGAGLDWLQTQSQVLSTHMCGVLGHQAYALPNAEGA